MSLLEILKRAGGAAAILVDGLARIREIAPDAAEEVDKILAALTAAVGSDNLIALAESLPKELANVAQGKIDPRKHASDVA
jgi:hypothetical protein